ncbi:FmdB family transcriptional regulator [Cryobacterium melibiosiphilum]|uniref:FmdB family transcriptional regulator n=1 Tax=Cryobacterium melibiosiphilum TaxID=995039 RepID=A0A3A5MB70_9MICO|nr:FmdB family zinc ribbon protein [Cryobacterium melibiosiphilum]RJT86200.1 FmdB family transcriptional regulator [Cryobacterium melibiosiphilum]
MPTYSYRCTECDTAFDIQQSFTDSSLTVCPTCEGKLRKVFSSIGVTFSGSGFYSNDSKSDAKRGLRAEKKSESSSSDSSSSSASSSSDSGSSSTATPAKKDSAASTKPASAPSTSSAPAKKAS